MPFYYFIAKWFYEVAEEKDYQDNKCFWICFWLGIIGWLLVIALPDRGERGNDKSAVIPPDTPVAGFMSGAMDIPKRKNAKERG